MSRSPAALLVLFVLLGAAGTAPQAAEVSVPPGLVGWEGWVLYGAEHRRCPFLFAQDPEQPGAYRCAWPGRLQLNLAARGGSFTQRWQVYSETWVLLPGNLEHWPREVRIGGAGAAVVERGGRPQLLLKPGDWTVAGRFEWTSRPETLDIPMQTGLVDLTIDGQRVAQPERPGGGLQLGKALRAVQAAALDVQVYRLVTDDIPGRLETQIRLQVSGDGREEVLAQALPAGFTPTALGGDLPARLDADGRLRVQVRPGSHTVMLSARAPDILAELRRPQVQAGGGAWARVEIWSFAGVDRLRIAAASGVDSVDPAQVDVPGGWRQLPAFRMEPASVLRIEETQRGLSSADANRLTLTRQLWLDFAHGGYTARDVVGGTMRQGWRLDMTAPYRLESARIGGQNLLVSESGDGQRRGVELRAPQLGLETLSRFEGGGSQPATGWAARFDNARGELNLPPGHRLLAAIGPDEAPGTWWAGWGLWSLFWVIIVAFLTYRIVGLWPALAALTALVLLYQEMPAMIWVWANLLITIGIAAVVPEGRLRRIVHGWRLLSAVLVVIVMLPFLWSQVRLALYPQLEAQGPVELQSMAQDAAAAAAAPPAEVTMEADVAAAEGEAAPTAAPPMRDERRRMVQGKVATNVVSDYASRVPQIVPRYAAGTALQAGPGIPSWRYRQYGYSWSGPVEAEDRVRFVVIGPFLLGLWRVLGAVLLVAWLVRLLQFAWRFDIPLPGGRRLAHGAAALMLALAGLLPQPARAESPAQATPDPSLLAELGNRLKARPVCYPSCATLTAARIDIAGDRLSVELDASALASVAVPVPTASDRWQIESVSVDGGAGFTLLREGDGSLWVPLRSGAHKVRLEGRVAPVASLQLGFPSVPRTVRVSASGWDVAGVTEGRMLSSAVELTRQRGNGAAVAGGAPLERGTEFPAFVRVTRDVSLDLDWMVATTVERIAPERASIAVEVPLMTGESVLTPGIEVRGGRAVLAGIPAGTAATGWQSGLERADALKLEMPRDAARVEVWRFSVNPQWHVEFAGQPAVLPDDVSAPSWFYTYYPRAGESLDVRVTRPKAAAGSTLAVDSVRQWIRYGVRSADAGVGFQYRSTQGGRHVIDLPADAQVEQVTLDGQPQQLRPEQGKLSIGLLPGEHQVEVQWRAPRGAAARVSTEAVNLNTPASNITSTIETPQDRWTLLAFARGAGVGPAVLYWSELVVFLVTAWALSRWRRSPLRTREWFLLGLGLSTLSAAVFTMVVLWVLALAWRASWSGDGPRWRFNLVQAVLAVATFFVISSLIFSGIRYGLLSTPDMGITGPGSYNGNFTWFRDRVDGALPQPLVISAPLWIYKALIIAWALWVAAAMVRWLQWAWQSWSAGGYWRSKDAA